MYKIIASDLDDTLLNTKTRRIDERNLEAIRRASEMGVKFVPASGRGYATIQKTLEELGLRDKENEYIISFNGGAITENKNNRRLYFKGITYEKMKMIFDASQSYDVCTHIYTDDTVYIYNINEGEEKFLWHRMDYIPIRKEEIQMLADKPLAKILFQNTDVKYLEKIAKDLEPITGDTFVSYSSNRYLEFNQQGVNKGQGLLSLAEILGVDPKDTIAIGDNDNDLTMIQAAGLGCCVSNATEAVKKNSDYIAEADCDEGGVAEIIEKFVLQ
ncbi:MAG: HAD family phosphatase [Lachnospiraceae bacterium]|nr:HAD family phosphatase [Lachnospiraceae bacterium]